MGTAFDMSKVEPNTKISFFIVSGAILALFAALFFSPFFSSVFTLASVNANPRWADATGNGIFVPACGSSASNSVPICVGPTGTVTLTWEPSPSHRAGSGSVLPNCEYVNIGSTKNGVPQPAINGLPCTGSQTFTGLESGATYAYIVYFDIVPDIAIDTATGSFTVPLCGVPIPLRCSPTPQSVNTGDPVNVRADFGSGSGYTWSAPGGVNSSGVGQTFQTSYLSAAGSPYTITTTDSLGATAQCSIAVTAPAPSCVVTPSSVSGPANSSQNVTISASNDADNRLPYVCSGSWGSNPTGVPVGPLNLTMPSDSQNCTLTARNSSGDEATCPLAINVTPPSTPVCSPTPVSLSTGQSQIFSVSGGTSPYSWTAPNSSNISGSGPSHSTTYTSSGSYSVTVTDSAARNSSCAVSVTNLIPPTAPTGDIDADNSDGPISKIAGASANLTWSSSDATSCRVQPGGWTGTSRGAPGENTGALSSTVTYTLYCSNANYTDVNVDSVTINISGAGLRPDYISSMSAPFSVRGGETFSVFSTISNYGERAYGGNSNAALCIWNTNQVNGAVIVSGSVAAQIASDGSCGPVDTKVISPLSNFPTAPYQQNVTFNWTASSFSPAYLANPLTNPYYAIVFADDGNIIFPEVSETNNVSMQPFTLLPPLLEASLTATPDSGPEILNVFLRSNVYGTSLGSSANYYFWWDCDNAATDVATAEGSCGILPSSASEIIVDNAASGVSDAEHSFSGNWPSGVLSLNGVPQGADSLSSFESSANYRITPNVPYAGSYGIYIWYQGRDCGGMCPFGFTPTYPVTVFDGTISNTTNVPLRGTFLNPPPPNGWYALGTFSLPAGNSAYVQFGTGYDSSFGSHIGIADAVRLVPAVGACTTNSVGANCFGVPTDVDLVTGEVTGGAGVSHGYNAAGSPYTPKVIVSSGGASDEARTAVTVYQNLADLVIQSYFPGSGLSTTEGTTLSFGADFMNMGFVDAPSSQVRLRIDLGNNNWTIGEPEYFISSGVIQKFSAGPPWNRFQARWLNFWPAVAGSHSYEICIDKVPDPNGAVTESDENNNCSPWTNFTVASNPVVPTVDIRANGSNGPISIPWGTAATLSWTSTDATSCTASGAWSGSKSISNSESTGNITSFPRTYTITCTGPGGTSAPDSVTINQSTPTLSINLTSNPSPATGNFPLAVNLTAAITAYTGNPSESVNYTFWWDCDDPSNDVAYLRQASVCGEPTDPAIGAKLDGRDAGQALPSESVSHTYVLGGAYTAKVVVERDSVTPQTDTVSVNVIIPPLGGLSCDVNPRTAKTGDNVTWSATWSGGQPNYTVTWTGDSPLPRTIISPSSPSSVTIQYSEPGEYDGSVKVTSLDDGGVLQTIGPATCLNTIRVAPRFEIR